MNILLINSNREIAPWPIIPTGVCRVATALQSSGNNVRLLDLTFSKTPASEVQAAVEDFSPQAIGLTIRNIDDVDARKEKFYIPDVLEDIVKPLRAAAGPVPLILGGSAVSIAPQQILQYLGADYAVIGDGERTAISLFASLAKGEKPADGNGYISSTHLENNNSHTPNHLDNLMDFPHSKAYKWIDVKAYASYGSSYGIQTKRGCDRTCTYCSYAAIEGTSYRLYDPVSIVDEIQEVYETSGMKKFEFIDSTFNIPKEHSLQILEELAKRKLPVNLDTMGLNPEGVDPEYIQALEAAGFKEVSCTPESGSAKMLKALGKKFTIEDAQNAAKHLDEADMPTKWYFMFGAPGENKETIQETFDFIDNHIPKKHLAIVMCGIRVLPGTALERTCKKNGLIPENNPLLEPFHIYGDLEKEELITTVATYVNQRSNVCHASGEVWNSPTLMKILHKYMTLRKMDKPDWWLLRLINRVRALWRPDR